MDLVAIKVLVVTLDIELSMTLSSELFHLHRFLLDWSELVFLSQMVKDQMESLASLPLRFSGFGVYCGGSWHHLPSCHLLQGQQSLLNA